MSPWAFGLTLRDAAKAPLLRAYDEYRPHPEELAKQASRRMDTMHGLAAILRDAAKRPLLRMRPCIWRAGKNYCPCCLIAQDTLTVTASVSSPCATGADTAMPAAILR